ncbi:hypothetical protein F1D61_33155 (plasmid) [Methylobacterium aquaticum]|nr:hypothetical protein F1D61_33155 [Methylobacterium aquaticum]
MTRADVSRVARTIVSRAAAEAQPVESRPVTKAHQRQRQGQADREARFQHVAALPRDGQGIRAIVRETGLSRNTVRHWLRAGTAPTWHKGERARIIDPFVPYLCGGSTKASATRRSFGASCRPRASGVA